VAFVPHPDARVLDHGCGEAIHADLVAMSRARVILCDAAPSVRAAIASRFAANRKIKVIAPEEVDHLGNVTLDSDLRQFHWCSPHLAELDATLAMWRRLLTPGGTLIVADVIPPNVGKLKRRLRAAALRRRERFLISAVVGLTRTVLSPYLRIRSQLGIARYDEAEFFARLRAAGFSAERLPKNVEHNPPA